MWAYAKLSKDASEAGGPEAFVASLAENSMELGRQEGQKEGFITGSLVTGSVFGFGWIVYKIWTSNKKKREEKKARLRKEIDDSKRMVTEIVGNQEYDNCEKDSHEE